MTARGGAGPAYVEQAISHYTKALRGAARPPAAGPVSAGFRRLAVIGYEAVRMRRGKDFHRASLMYQKSIDLLQEGQLLQASEVSAAVAAAHTSLNLALTEKALGRLEEARKVFQKGCSMVQSLLYRSVGAQVGREDICWRRGACPGERERDVAQEALRWLATLLTAWALLETQLGRSTVGRYLARRAARFDAQKEVVLKWQVMCDGKRSS